MRDKKEWTLMFYFASDNPLAPGVISQLKAIKAAGFHKEANVIVQFDPYTEDTPTHIFDVNVTRKLKSKAESDVGFRSNDSYVHNLLEDKLWGEEKDRHGNSIRDRIKQDLEGYNPGIPPNGNGNHNGNYSEPSPQQSLHNLLSFCAEWYPANHYMLFILGHGVVVGNDIFLLDEHAEEHTLTLNGLREELEVFNAKIGKHDGQLQLVSFHSCSVSSLEVAYELKDTARYMLASQGTAYIGSWPYRQMLIRIFNRVRKDMTPETIDPMLKDLYSYCIHNSTDFLLAGYPFDISLCNLGGVSKTRAAMERLSGALIKGLHKPALKESIVLSHLKAQSFHREMYTDIIDFCRCLYSRTSTTREEEDLKVLSEEIQAACKDVIASIRESVLSSFAGPEYQYAKGLSIYFPWSKPAEEVMDRYAAYKFVMKEFGSEESESVKSGPEESESVKSETDQITWFGLLKEYFDITRRDSIRDEAAAYMEDLGEKPPRRPKPEDELLEDKIALVYTQAAPQTSGYALDAGPDRPVKGDPKDPLGGCTCASIKNYPRDTRRRKERTQAKGLFALDVEFFNN